MSVMARFRKPTNADYVNELWELRKYSLYRCTRFPKRYKEWFTDDIILFTKRAHEFAFEANMIFPKTAKEAQLREEYLTKAQRALAQIYPQLELAYDMCRFDDEMDNSKVLTTCWLPKIDKCEALLKAIKEKDKKRYKDLK